MGYCYLEMGYKMLFDPYLNPFLEMTSFLKTVFCIFCNGLMLIIIAIVSRGMKNCEDLLEKPSHE
jgi:hypothetical protein